MKERILLYGGFTLAAILAFLYFVRTQELKYELDAASQRLDSVTNYSERVVNLISIDSLLASGNYNEALKAYENQFGGNEELLNTELRLRAAIAQRLLELENFAARKNIKDRDTVTADTIIMQVAATPDEIRKYDSINFALQKAQAQLLNFRRQLNEKSFGEYLTFTSSKGNKVHYVGEVADGKAQGSGIGLWDTGGRYQGMWRNGLRHGEGSYYWPDGEYYIGEYKNDRRTGQGTYYWPNGEKYVGEWENDQRNGEGIFYSEDGQVMARGTWKNDELVKVEKD